MAETLRECPFCGGESALHGNALKHWVKCFACGAHGGMNATESAAIAAWNRRAEPRCPDGGPDFASVDLDVTVPPDSQGGVSGKNYDLGEPRPAPPEPTQDYGRILDPRHEGLGIVAGPTQEPVAWLLRMQIDSGEWTNLRVTLARPRDATDPRSGWTPLYASPPVAQERERDTLLAVAALGECVGPALSGAAVARELARMGFRIVRAPHVATEPTGGET